MNIPAPTLLALVATTTDAQVPTAVFIVIPILTALAGLYVLTHYAENTTARAQNRTRRQYRFKINKHESSGAQTAARASGTTKPGNGGTARTEATSVTEQVLREAVTGAKEALNPQNARTAPPPPPPKSDMPARDPKRLAPAGKSVGAGKVELAPNGFWIGAGTAPNGSIIVYRWHDGSRRHDGRVTFAPETSTGGHYVHTGTKPVQVTLVGFEAPR